MVYLEVIGSRLALTSVIHRSRWAPRIDVMSVLEGPSPRSATPELRGRTVSGSPGRGVRAGSANALQRGRYLRRGADDLLKGLSDGDLCGVRSTEAAYNARAAESGPTFGDYELDFPPGLKAPDGPKQQDPPRDDAEVFSAA